MKGSMEGRESAARLYKSKRLSVGWSQEDLASRLGVTRATVNRRERGLCEIGGEQMIALDHLVQMETGRRKRSRDVNV